MKQTPRGQQGGLSCPSLVSISSATARPIGTSENRIQGHTPTSLNETGRAQADLLARFFAACPLTAVWSSDLPRAEETAARIAAPHGLAVRIVPALRERNMEPFEGMTGDEVNEALKGAGPGGRDLTSWYEVPGVEQDESVLARVTRGAARRRAPWRGRPSS